MFEEFTWVWWASCGSGAVLGYVAASIRAAGTQFDGKLWVLALGTLAGAVVGTVIFLANILFAATFLSFSGIVSPRQVLAITLVVLVAMFAAFVLRGKYQR